MNQLNSKKADLFFNKKLFDMRLKNPGNQLASLSCDPNLNQYILGKREESSVFDFDYTDANIEAYMQNGLDNNIGSTQIDDAIIFPLITHTDRLIYKTQTDLEAGTNNVYTGSDTNVRGVKFNQLKPAIRLHALIVAIQNHYDGIEF